MAVPRLQEAALRLSMARHEARVEDLLEGTEPIVRLVLRPWRSPLSSGDPAEGRLEIGIQDLDQEHVTLRYWVSGTDESAVLEHRIATTKLTSSWLDSRLLDFIGLVLDEA